MQKSMTPRQRLLGALTGKELDRTPFSPFLAYYFESLPMEIQKKGQLSYLEDMGADPLLRGWDFAWKKRSKVCRLEEQTKGNKRVVTIKVPSGALQMEYTYVQESNTWFLTKHPVSTVEELHLLAEYFSDLELEADVKSYNEKQRELGERALALPLVGVDMKTSFQSLVEVWVGTENLTYLVYDYPEEIEQLLSIMREKSQKTVEYTLLSEAEGAIFWEDSSTTNVSPNMYRTFIQPEITQWAALFRQSGKLLIQHACGHIRDLIPCMAEQGIHGIESVTPVPTGNVTPEEVFFFVPQQIAVIGGIDPTVLLRSSMEELEIMVKGLLKLAEGRRFILSNSDSCPPGVEYNKFLRLAELVKTNRQKEQSTLF